MHASSVFVAKCLAYTSKAITNRPEKMITVWLGGFSFFLFFFFLISLLCVEVVVQLI